MRFSVRLTPKAAADMRALRDYIAENSSKSRANAYIRRLQIFLKKLEVFPKRGSLRHDLGDGLRIIGFEGRITVAFLVEDHSVFILRILYAGKGFDDGAI